MVFRIQANLRFATVGDRTAAQTTIATAVGGRGTIVRRNQPFTRDGVPELSWEGTEADVADPRVVYNAIAGLTTPLLGSRLYYHACPHGDNTDPCVKTAEKIWP